MNECNFLIIGAGITGLTIARALILRGQKKIIVIEKEEKIGVHASGKNSGVLHAGIYYTPNSLKARFCVEGNRMLTEYCESRNIRLNRCGKVIVATDKNKLSSLYELQRKAVQNGVDSRIINSSELKDFEPYAYTYKDAIFSPDTSVFNPKEILDSIYNELIESGHVKILFNTSFLNPSSDNTVLTSNGQLKYGSLINASGAYSDKIAHSFGTAENYRILPFLGTYSKIREKNSEFVRGNVYPVPDDRTPFLGIHFTRSHDGTVYIGPTAIPAIGRESYDFVSGISLESIPILYRDFVMFLSNSAFRDNALSEVRKYLSSYLFEEAKKMIPSIEKDQVIHSNKAGIRPQLVDWSKKDLVMDFIVIEKGNTLHILNAISPAFSSSMAFAKYVADEYLC